MLVNLPDAYDRSDLVSNHFWSKKKHRNSDLFLKQFYFRFGFLLLNKKIKSQETVPESAGEDREVALLRR
jgi:hypothetical protein